MCVCNVRKANLSECALNQRFHYSAYSYRHFLHAIEMDRVCMCVCNVQRANLSGCPKSGFTTVHGYRHLLKWTWYVYVCGVQKANQEEKDAAMERAAEAMKVAVEEERGRAKVSQDG